MNGRQELAVPGVAKGTLIMTTRGLIPAEDIRTGDMVLTHTGAWQQVTKVQRSSGPVVALKGGGRTLTCTPGQKLLCRDAGEQWTQAQQAAGRQWASPAEADQLPFPVPADRTLINENVFRIAGAFAAAGSVKQGDAHIITGSGAAGLLENAIVCVTRDWMAQETEQGTDLHIMNAGLNEWLLDSFGPPDNTVPAWALGLPDPWRTALWSGLLTAGARAHAHDTITLNAADMRAALMLLLLGQTLGLQGTVSPADGGRITVTMKTQPQKLKTVWQETDGEVSAAGADVPVFSFTVSRDGSFVANGVIVQGAEPDHWITMDFEPEAAAVPA